MYSIMLSQGIQESIEALAIDVPMYINFAPIAYFAVTFAVFMLLREKGTLKSGNLSIVLFLFGIITPFFLLLFWSLDYNMDEKDAAKENLEKVTVENIQENIDLHDVHIETQKLDDHEYTITVRAQDEHGDFFLLDMEHNKELDTMTPIAVRDFSDLPIVEDSVVDELFTLKSAN